MMTVRLFFFLYFFLFLFFIFIISIVSFAVLFGYWETAGKSKIWIFVCVFLSSFGIRNIDTKLRLIVKINKMRNLIDLIFLNSVFLAAKCSCLIIFFIFLQWQVMFFNFSFWFINRTCFPWSRSCCFNCSAEWDSTNAVFLFFYIPIQMNFKEHWIVLQLPLLNL